MGIRLPTAPTPIARNGTAPSWLRLEIFPKSSGFIGIPLGSQIRARAWGLGLRGARGLGFRGLGLGFRDLEIGVGV